MSLDKVQRAVDVLLEDFTRQSSHLDSTQVERTCDKRGLDPAERVDVLARLAERGVHIEKTQVTGYAAKHAIKAPLQRRSSDAEIDIVKLYLRDIGKVRLLTPDEEIVLARRIKAGEEARQLLLCGTSTLSDDSGRRLRRLVREGDAAFDQMMLGNLRLVVDIAKRHQHRSKSLELLDLIQEGTLGLRRAVQKFDHTKGFKFSTYATWWIRQAITRTIADKGRSIRLPVHVVETVNEITQATRYLEGTVGRTPRLDEIADYVNMPAGKVQALLDIARDPVSLDAPVTRMSNEDDGLELEEFIDMPSVFGDPAELGDEKLTSETIHDCLSELTPRERAVIDMRFGLDGHDVHTLEDIGTQFGVTRERIRQIENKTLKQLSQVNGLKNLRYEFWPPRSEPPKKTKGQKANKTSAEGQGSVYPARVL